MEEQGYANSKGKQQVNHKSDSKLHANKFWQKNRSFAGTTVSAKSLFAPLRIDNVAEVQFFWHLYEQLHPKSSKDFSAMAEQWNTITTMQLHTDNSQFKFVKLKRGSHLSKFWHSEGHKHLQRDASNIAALIQGVSPADVSSVGPPMALAASLPASAPLDSPLAGPFAAPAAAAQSAAPQFPHFGTAFPPLPPPSPPMQPAQKRSRTEQRNQTGNKDSKCRPHHAHAWLQACNTASRVVDPRQIPEISKKSIVQHNPCSYGAAFKQVWAKPMFDNTPPPPQFAGWTSLHKSVYDAYSKLPGRQPLLERLLAEQALS